jgi:hypothetical protein
LPNKVGFTPHQRKALIIIETSSSSPIAVCVRSIPDGEVEEEVSIIINAPTSCFTGLM